MRSTWQDDAAALADPARVTLTRHPPLLDHREAISKHVAYEAGQIDFVRYQLLRREALDARRDRIDSLEAPNRAEALLERALGRRS